MASIIEFRRPGFMDRPHGSRSISSVSADVVIFPGVRYERHVDEPEPEIAKPRSRRSRRRDRLELDD